MKKLFNFILVMTISFLAFGLTANAATAPVYDDSKDIFYANGTAITIGTRTGDEGATITWTGGSQDVNPETVIFGGAKEANVASSNITMNNGMVKDIFGGGQGSTTVSANVDTAVITMNGGVLHAIAGGGYLKSTVKNTTINLKNGVVGNIHGGGYAAGQNHITTSADATGTAEHPEQSTTIVEKATINITGGRVNDANATPVPFGTIFGGGLGYQYVKDTTINVGGTFGLNTDYLYLTVGGANGRTDKGRLNITDGIVYIVQTVNRGSIGEAYVKMTGGKVTNMYAGGETGDSTVTGTITTKAVISINGGEITSLTTGKSGGTLMTASSSLKELYLADAATVTVANRSNLSTLFGTIHQLGNMDEFGNMVMEPETLEELPVDKFKDAKELGHTYSYSTEEYAWAFKGTDITDTTIVVDPEITVTDIAPADIKEDLEKLIPENSNVKFLNFAHDGKLPGKANIRIGVSSEEYKVGDVIYIAHYNETKKVLENSIKTTVKSLSPVDEESDTLAKLFIEFDIIECSTYTASNTSLVKNPDTGDNIMLYIALGMITLIGTTVLITRKRFN